MIRHAPGRQLTVVHFVLPSSIRYSRPYLAMRRLGRALGLNAILARLFGGGRYEDRFDRAFCASLRARDCVWDVGANMGHYTRLFSTAVGPAGRVLAFEPGPINATALETATTELANVERLTVALGNARGQLKFWQADPTQGFQSRCLTDVESSGLSTIMVDVRRGDDIVRETPAANPNAVKIDVEGFELEVLQGLGALLASSVLHTIGVEVHSTILEQRGLATAPRDIAQLLATHGFRVRWVDHSHLIAHRGP